MTTATITDLELLKTRVSGAVGSRRATNRPTHAGAAIAGSILGDTFGRK